MATKEEIREEIALLIPFDCGNCYLVGSREIRDDCDNLEEPGFPCLLQLFLAKGYLNYLCSQGVVLKVERELPDSLMEGQIAYDKPTYIEMLKRAGYCAVEPLVEE